MDTISLFLCIVVYVFIFCVVAFFTVSLLLVAYSDPYPIIEQFEGEDCYYDPRSKTKKKFPSINDPPSVAISVIVPAYNEEERLSPMLDEAIEYLEGQLKISPKNTYEIIVVSDGSVDNTVQLAESYSEKFGTDKIRCLKLFKNRGKGGAVRMGVQKARGSLILFADADGASKFSDLSKLEETLRKFKKLDLNMPPNVEDCPLIVIGSRKHLQNEALAKRNYFRNLLMYGFHFLVWTLTVRGIHDTQCGFKLFTRKTAKTCFQNLHVTGWAFDVELLYIAKSLKYKIIEIGINWTEIDGSKITPVLSWIQMGIDLITIWLKYRLGAWKIKREEFIN